MKEKIDGENHTWQEKLKIIQTEYMDEKIRSREEFKEQLKNYAECNVDALNVSIYQLFIGCLTVRYLQVCACKHKIVIYMIRL